MSSIQAHLGITKGRERRVKLRRPPARAEHHGRWA